MSGRPAPNGLDAFVYAERGVYRSNETVYVTGLLRDAQGAAALNVPLTFVVARPDGVEYQRTLVQDQGLGGHARTLPLAASAPTGTWHVRAFTDPKRPPVGETTFLVEDYVPDRFEFDLNATSSTVSQKSPASFNVAGRSFMAPLHRVSILKNMTICGQRRSPATLLRKRPAGTPLTTNRRRLTIRQSQLQRDRQPPSGRGRGAKIVGWPSWRTGGGTVTLPVRRRQHDRSSAVQRPVTGDGASAAFDVMPRRMALRLRKAGCTTSCCASAHYQFWHDNEGISSRSKPQRAPTQRRCDADARPHFPAGTSAATSSMFRAPARTARPARRVDSGWYVDASATRLTCWKPHHKSRYRLATMTVAVSARTAGS